MHIAGEDFYRFLVKTVERYFVTMKPQGNIFTQVLPYKPSADILPKKYKAATLMIIFILTIEIMCTAYRPHACTGRQRSNHNRIPFQEKGWQLYLVADTYAAD